MSKLSPAVYNLIDRLNELTAYIETLHSAAKQVIKELDLHPESEKDQKLIDQGGEPNG